MKDDNSALVLIDIQNDFCPGGALAVARGDEIIPHANTLIYDHRHVILTQDWHPVAHSSFATTHAGAEPYTSITMPYGEQTLWPEHCLQGSNGAEFHRDLDQNRAELIVRKGFREGIDSYSAFFENDHRTPTGLAGYLRERGLNKLFMAGLATDFCVAYSAIDAAGLGFDVRVLVHACRAIDLDGSLDAALGQMKDAGVSLVDA